MSEFIPPKKAFVDAKSYINEMFQMPLEKDLHGNEEICEFCRGTGIIKTDNVYGLSDDPNKHAGMLFPYKHQAITFCPQCYNGVVHRCPDCGALLPKGRLTCTCKAVRDREFAERHVKYLEALAKAQEHGPDALGTVFGMCYSPDIYKNEGYFSDWESFFDSWANQDNDEKDRPVYVWGTHSKGISFNVDSLLENATCDLYEDAGSNISVEAESQLREFLSTWCEHCGVGPTYYQDTRHKVKIPWEDYK